MPCSRLDDCANSIDPILRLRGAGPSDWMPGLSRVKLPEDRVMRGLVWTQWHFARDVCIHADDDIKSLPAVSLATNNEERSLAARLLYLGIAVASTSRFMQSHS